MASPVLTNWQRYVRYGRNRLAVERQLVNVTLFGVPDVWLHRKVVERFKAWEKSVRDYENGIVIVAGKRRKRVLHPWQPHEIQSFNWRLIRGSRTRSLHSFGVAIDVDPALNPQGSQRTNIPPYVTNRAIKRGITWGGNWRGKRRDPMHFEIRR